MLNETNLILPLILLFIISIVLIVVAICIAHLSRKTIKEYSTSIDNDCSNYKNELKKQNDALTKQLLGQLSEYMASGANSKNEKLMNVFNKLGKSIKENCINSMNQIGAVRIAIYLFHNGTHSLNGINFVKMSCICEKVAIGSGIRERMMEITNVPINLFDEMTEHLINYNRYIIMNNEEVQDKNHKLLISGDKIHYVQLVTIYDIDNNMLGFVAAEMDRPYSKDEADKEKEILDVLVKQLVPVMSYSDYTLLKN